MDVLELVVSLRLETACTTCFRARRVHTRKDVSGIDECFRG